MPTVKLTKTTVERAEPPAKGQVFLWDTELRGFGLGVQSSGHRSYVVRYRVRGSRRDRRMVIGRHGPLTVQQARDEAKRILGLVSQGHDPAAERREEREALLVRELGEIYLAEYAAQRHKDGGLEARRKLERDVYPRIGRLRVEDVSQADLDRLHAAITRQGPTQANRTLALLSGLFTFAEKRGLRPQGSNPCKYVQRNAERARERYLTDQELRAYFKGLAETEREKPRTALACDALRVMLLTGARKTEVLSLRWEDVDFQRRMAVLPDTKTGRRPLRLPQAAVEILRRRNRKRDGSPWVFPGRGKKGYLAEVKVTHAEACRRAGIRDLRVHDLRHSFASVAVAGGHSIPVIGKALGHARSTTTERYSHLAEDPVRHMVDTTGEHLARMMETEEGGEG